MCWQQRLSLSLLFACSLVRCGWSEERTERFDTDPHWDGRNHRATYLEPRMIRQDFGYSPTHHAGGKSPGELGGLLTPSGEPTYCAKRIEPATFDDVLTASGKLACTGRHFHVLVGFFNADTINEWRNPNAVMLRLYGRGDVFYAYVEYMTGRWRAGGDSPGGFALVDEPEGGKRLRGFATQGKVHDWSIKYDPKANQGRGSVIVTIDDETAICDLTAGHKQDGAAFNRFGVLNIPKHFDSGGEVWLDDITVNAEIDTFDGGLPPDWEEVGNRAEYLTSDIRPKFDFGYSPTQFAGGAMPGELGGVVFRGDNRDPNKMACYGDRLSPLTLDKPLKASGKVGMRRGVSDSTSLIGFFHSEHSMKVSPQQTSGFPMNFLGVAIEGPSSEGFYFYPVYRFPGGADAYARSTELPHIYPDGKVHDWSLHYDPQAKQGAGQIKITFDETTFALDLAEGHRQARAEFDRFGIVTTWIDGNAQRVYFDDLTYTFRQED